MKKLFFTLITALFCASLGYAQPARDGKGPGQVSPEERAKTEVQDLTKKLALDEDQQKSILNYLTESNTNLQKIMQEAGDDREAAFAKMKAQHDEQSVKIKTFLNEEQIKKYNALLKEREKNRPKRPQND